MPRRRSGTKRNSLYHISNDIRGPVTLEVLRSLRAVKGEARLVTGETLVCQVGESEWKRLADFMDKPVKSEKPAKSRGTGKIGAACARRRAEVIGAAKVAGGPGGTMEFSRWRKPPELALSTTRPGRGGGKKKKKELSRPAPLRGLTEKTDDSGGFRHRLNSVVPPGLRSFTVQGRSG
ncbi:hypothetical protein CfE428DRAFT_1551 [Chthoniobacter flavus Ellin428]|uniref:Uncharacterized protein n=1 Tax=Chthoniobacter flavus Ellin428 TaxID=497964 RepID=B4CWT8_9BACT|nr:DUF4339 domain-containing protein [Chthoniobacter flavus]EDY21258.1 hypothetical protein CfE428DRAFT_1551 [Chthoniobacter flavus Ellin428]